MSIKWVVVKCPSPPTGRGALFSKLGSEDVEEDMIHEHPSQSSDLCLESLLWYPSDKGKPLSKKGAGWSHLYYMWSTRRNNRTYPVGMPFCSQRMGPSLGEDIENKLLGSELLSTHETNVRKIVEQGVWVVGYGHMVDMECTQQSSVSECTIPPWGDF